MRTPFKHRLQNFPAFSPSIKHSMSIRNATILRRRRKISLSEQEHPGQEARRRRRHEKAGSSVKAPGSVPSLGTEKIASWHANWAEG